MNETKFDSSLSELKEDAVVIFKLYCPVDSGYQRDTIRAKDSLDGGFEIIANTDYVQYTTDPWVGRTSKNPNEDWHKEAAEYFIRFAKSKLSK